MTDTPDYISLPAWAALHGLDRSNAWVLLKAGRIAGAIRIGREWAIPRNAPKPERLTPGAKPRGTTKNPDETKN